MNQYVIRKFSRGVIGTIQPLSVSHSLHFLWLVKCDNCHLVRMVPTWILREGNVCIFYYFFLFCPLFFIYYFLRPFPPLFFFFFWGFFPLSESLSFGGFSGGVLAAHGALIFLFYFWCYLCFCYIYICMYVWVLFVIFFVLQMLTCLVAYQC